MPLHSVYTGGCLGFFGFLGPPQAGAGTAIMASDNISETSASGLKLVFLAPGMVIQWWKFMFVGDQKTYGGVRQQTRLARSELMTWVYSSVFWFVVLAVGLVSLAGRYLPRRDRQDQAFEPGAREPVRRNDRRQRHQESARSRALLRRFLQQQVGQTATSRPDRNKQARNAEAGPGRPPRLRAALPPEPGSRRR